MRREAGQKAQPLETSDYGHEEAMRDLDGLSCFGYLDIDGLITAREVCDRLRAHIEQLSKARSIDSSLIVRRNGDNALDLDPFFSSGEGAMCDERR